MLDAITGAAEAKAGGPAGEARPLDTSAAPDQPGAPSDAGPQLQLGIARDQLEDLDQADIEGLRDSRDRIVEELLQIVLGERPFGQPRHRGLLTGTDAQLALARRRGMVGDIAADAEQLQRLAVHAQGGDDRL